jgi:hypothetical protein
LAFTTSFGRTRCRPFTTIRSPGSKPFAIPRRQVAQRAERDFAVWHAVVRVNHHHELLVLVGPDRGIVAQHSQMRRASVYLDACIEPWHSEPSALSKLARCIIRKSGL